jgi:hypothetical protein
VDRAYNDYAMLYNWNTRGFYFVCRVKDNMRYSVVEYLPNPNKVKSLGYERQRRQDPNLRGLDNHPDHEVSTSNHQAGVANGKANCHSPVWD